MRVGSETQPTGDNWMLATTDDPLTDVPGGPPREADTEVGRGFGPRGR